MRSSEGTEKEQSLKEENQDGAREGALRWGFISDSAVSRTTQYKGEMERNRRQCISDVS